MMTDAHLSTLSTAARAARAKTRATGGMMDVSPARLADLLIDPREDLDLEIKNWLDLRSDENARATLAKALLALANHGGGFLVLGLAETELGVREAGQEWDMLLAALPRRSTR
jgi:hypothetical protein